MIHTDERYGLVFECDECEVTEALKGYTFLEAITRIKQLGWRITKNEMTGEWEHYCPECRGLCGV